MGEVSVASGISWQGRGKIRTVDGSEISDIEVSLIGDLQKWVVIERAASDTASWPRPATPGATVDLFCDYELFDPNGLTVLTGERLRVLVEFDPTRTE